jgi:hypothetical protein
MAALDREIKHLKRKLEGTFDEAERSTIQKKIEVKRLLLHNFMSGYVEYPSSKL